MLWDEELPIEAETAAAIQAWVDGPDGPRFFGVGVGVRAAYAAGRFMSKYLPADRRSDMFELGRGRELARIALANFYRKSV